MSLYEAGKHLPEAEPPPSNGFAGGPEFIGGLRGLAACDATWTLA